MYTTIEIDFDVHKKLTSLRDTPEVKENDVLRELLGLSPVEQSNNSEQKPAVKPYVWKGVTFPHGTELRAEYNKQRYNAKIENGAIIYEDTSYTAPSTVAEAITGKAWNGWKFFECRMPGKKQWILMDKLRSK